MHNNNIVTSAIIGCGNIAIQYADQLKRDNSLKIKGWYDSVPERAKSLADSHGGIVYRSLDAALIDPEIHLIINLTNPASHEPVTRAALEHGKHIYSEKPFALTSADAFKLADLARKKNLVLKSAPINYLGDAQAVFHSLIRDGKVGTPRLAYSEINQGRIESWHPEPEDFYDVGIMWDAGIYSLTFFSAIFGNVASLQAFSDYLMPERKRLDGNLYRIGKPDFILCLIRFESGLLLRLTANFYTNRNKQGTSIEVHGDDGQAYLGSVYNFDCDVAFAKTDDELTSIPIQNAFVGNEFARGVMETGRIIRGESARIQDIELSCHVIEVLEAIEKSIATNQEVHLSS